MVNILVKRHVLPLSNYFSNVAKSALYAGGKRAVDYSATSFSHIHHAGTMNEVKDFLLFICIV